MSYLGLAGFALMIMIVALLLWGKSTPAVVFILLPIIVGFAVGFTPEEMSGYIASGVSGVATTAILFIFAVLFFGVMNDAGVFERIVGKVLKLVDVIFLITIESISNKSSSSVTSPIALNPQKSISVL